MFSIGPTGEGPKREPGLSGPWEGLWLSVQKAWMLGLITSLSHTHQENRMFEARLTQGGLLKKLLDAVKDLVTDGNFDCSNTGFGLQAMDTSHVSLVSMMLRSDGFDHYRCDRNISMGMNLVNMAKMLKCANDKDIVTMKVTALPVPAREL